MGPSNAEGVTAKPHLLTSRTRVPLGPRTYLVDHRQDQRPPSTFGFPLSAADELEMDRTIMGLDGPQRQLSEERTASTVLAYHRDVLIARAGHRWYGDPLSPRHVEYVPGDVCGLRASSFQGSYATAAKLLRSPDRPLTGDEKSDVGWEMGHAAWFYDAVPFFVPTMTLLGIAGSEPPTVELLGELRLPFPRVAVLFGADLGLPPTLVGGEEILAERAAFHDRQLGQENTELPAHMVPPQRLHAAVLGTYRKRPVCLAGVIIDAGPDGIGLSDTVMWLTVTDTHDGAVTRRADPAFLSASRLAPIVHNAAAAVAWGHWDMPPTPLGLPDDPTSKAFRDGLRRGQFRRREPSGAAAGVHIIAVDPPRATSEPVSLATHSSPVTHLRRGHIRRQRVGPHDNWKYEIRWINPVLVNPQFSPGPGGVTVYRLPDPNRP